MARRERRFSHPRIHSCLESGPPGPLSEALATASGTLGHGPNLLAELVERDPPSIHTGGPPSTLQRSRSRSVASLATVGLPGGPMWPGGGRWFRIETPWPCAGFRRHRAYRLGSSGLPQVGKVVQGVAQVSRRGWCHCQTFPMQSPPHLPSPNRGIFHQDYLS